MHTYIIRTNLLTHYNCMFHPSRGHLKRVQLTHVDSKVNKSCVLDVKFLKSERTSKVTIVIKMYKRKNYKIFINY